MNHPPTRAFYLTQGHEPVYALFDDVADPTNPPLAPPQFRPNTAATSTIRQMQGPVGVLLCPLFGNDDLCAYRARREWAKKLAAGGNPTLRFDLPGTGDSAGGPYDPGRLDAWTEALATTAAWLRGEAGCARVVSIGIGLCGLLSYRAAAHGAPIDDLVLWSVPARGRTFVRQLRALSQMEASRETDRGSATILGEDGAQKSNLGTASAISVSAAPILEPGALASAGFVISAETVAALETLDLTKLDLPDAPSRRVLMLERDGLEVDGRLRASLEQSGAKVTVAPGAGYGAMVAPPQQSHQPLGVIATVDKWLAESPVTPATRVLLAKTETTSTLDLHIEGTHIRELPIAIRQGGDQLAGVLAEPDGPAQFCAVMLNAGALRHIGPNRMWVEIARRWAARGVTTLRIDLAGIGDTDGDASALEEDEGFYVPRYVEQTHEVLAALTARGLPSRFVLCGLCSGAYWSLHAALEDERVNGAFLVNPRALFWDPSIEGVREARNVRKLLRPVTWHKLVRGQIERERIRAIARGIGIALASLPARVRAYRRNRPTGGNQLDRALERLDANGTELLGVFTAREPVFEELVRKGDLERARSHSNVRVESIPGPLTSHTLEPLELQRTVSTLLDDALTRLLDRHSNSDKGDTQDEPRASFD